MKKSIILLIIVILMISIVSCNQKPVQDELGVIDIEPDNTDKETKTPPTDTNIEKTEKPTEQPSTEKEEVTNINEPQPENKTESENEEVKPETESDKQEDSINSSDDYTIITHTDYATVLMQELIEGAHIVAECEYIKYIGQVRVKSDSGQFQNYTDIKMKVNKVYRGQTDEQEITVRLPGGNIGGVTQSSGLTPLFRSDKKYIVFLCTPDIYSNEFTTDENYYTLVNYRCAAFVYDESISETEEYYNCSRLTMNSRWYIEFMGQEHLKENADNIVISKDNFEQVMTDINELIPVTDFYKEQALQRIENDYNNGDISKSEYEAKTSKDKPYAEIIERI